MSIDVGGGFLGIGLLFLLLNIAFYGVLIAAIFFGIRWLIRTTQGEGNRPNQRRDDEALALLRQRFANGEIDAAEFEERKRTLGG